MRSDEPGCRVTSTGRPTHFAIVIGPVAWRKKLAKNMLKKPGTYMRDVRIRGDRPIKRLWTKRTTLLGVVSEGAVATGKRATMSALERHTREPYKHNRGGPLPQ